MDKSEISIGLLRDKLKEFGSVDYALDNRVTEGYVLEPQEELLALGDGLKKQEARAKVYRRLLSLYDKLRFLNFIYYLAPFAFVFGSIALLLANRGALLLLFALLALGKFALGKSLDLGLRRQEYLLQEAIEKKDFLEQEMEKRGDEREALLARAGILAAEIRYLEHYLNNAS